MVRLTQWGATRLPANTRLKQAVDKQTEVEEDVRKVEFSDKIMAGNQRVVFIHKLECVCVGLGCKCCSVVYLSCVSEISILFGMDKIKLIAFLFYCC